MSVKILCLNSKNQMVEVSEKKFNSTYGSNTDQDKRLNSVKKNNKVPTVGSIVRFNDVGLEQCFGSAIGKSFMKRMDMRITYVDDTSMTYPEPTFVVEVDNPDINQFMIDHNCFDIVRR